MRALVLATVGLAAGCETDPVDHICPDVTSGGLVITEIRGDQSPDDMLGQWVEVYNATGVALDLAGLKLRVRTLDGSSEDRILIRRSVMVDVDGYAVIGLGSDDPQFRPEYIDYGAGTDAGDKLPATGAVDVDACDDPGMDEFADQVIVRTALPTTGTYSLGVQPPTATANDTDASWCTSLTAMGTPGEANDPCP